MKKLPDGSTDITQEWMHGLGTTAGLLWHYLGKHGLVPLKRLEMDADKIVSYDLKEILEPGLRLRDGIYMALGWLACEHKIMEFRNTATQETSFCLNQTEQEAYWKRYGYYES